MRFLDPRTKSGVFLREITRRLAKGLADEIPDLATRVDHILTKLRLQPGQTLSAHEAPPDLETTNQQPVYEE